MIQDIIPKKHLKFNHTLDTLYMYPPSRPPISSTSGTNNYL